MSETARGPDEIEVSFVMPCLDEAETLEDCISTAQRCIATHALTAEIVVADNGSRDGSQDLARRCGAVVAEVAEKGYGSALMGGMAAARGRFVVMGDADMSYDFGEAMPMVEKLREGADLVMGSRFRGRIEPGAMPWLHRWIGNPALTRIGRVLFGVAVSDFHCGLRAARRDALRDLNLRTTGMEFASEMVIRAIHNRLRIHEREIIYHPRIGESKLRSFKDGWRHLRFMLLHSPTMVLLIPGALGWFFGLMLAVPIAFGPIVISGRSFDTHFMMAAGILNVICAQMVGIGMIAKAYAHLSGLRKDPVVAWFYRWFSFEKAALAGGVIFFGGIVTTAVIVLKWIGGGFGSLDEVRPFFLAFLLIVNGVQFLGLAYLFSIMALPRRFDEENGRG
jgi:hypothetical protein